MFYEQYAGAARDRRLRRRRFWREVREIIDAQWKLYALIAIVVALSVAGIMSYAPPCETIGECQKARIEKQIEEARTKPLPSFNK